MAEHMANLNINSEEVYSTDETLIGIYCGHRLYRKVITGETTPTTSTQGTIASKQISTGADFSKAISVRGIAITSDQDRDIILPYAQGSATLSARALPRTYTAAPNKIEVFNNNVSWNNLPLEITIDYIKD